ncbi:MAG: NADH:ubiquinone reductase (Na(+)-transporting) subunit F [Pseudomonadota bacterium]
MIAVGFSVAFFAAVVLALTALVLAARRWLVPADDVPVEINGRPFLLGPGRNVLRGLAEQGIYLPSPCGGRAMCGQCKVTMPGAAALPTEASLLSRSELRRGVRLACVHRARAGLALTLPDALLAAERRVCTVVETRFVSTFLKEITLALPEAARLGFSAGQYVMLEAPPYRLALGSLTVDDEYRGTWNDAGLNDLIAVNDTPTSRAYSLANAPGDDDRAVVVVRIALPPAGAPAGTPPGVVSSYLFSLAPGDRIGLTGPYGDFSVTSTDGELVLIGGGAGIAPMRSIIHDQLSRGRSERRISFWYGARARRDLCYADEFDGLAAAHANFDWHVALSAPAAEDRWNGPTGFIHAVVRDAYLSTHPAPEDIDYYLCGPPLMSRACIAMLEDLGVDPAGIHLDDFGATT